MKFRNGISASGRLFLAALCFEKGDLAGAEAALAAMPKSRVALLNDEKHLLRSQVLAAGGKITEAEAVLNQMLADKKTAVAKEAVLLQLAKLQIKEPAQRGSGLDAEAHPVGVRQHPRRHGGAEPAGHAGRRRSPGPLKPRLRTGVARGRPGYIPFLISSQTLT